MALYIFHIHHTCLWLQRAVWADSKSMDCCMCDCHFNAVHFRWLSHWVSDVRVMWYSKWHWYLPLGNICVCVCARFQLAVWQKRNKQETINSARAVKDSVFLEHDSLLFKYLTSNSFRPVARLDLSVLEINTTHKERVICLYSHRILMSLIILLYYFKSM